MAEKTPDGGCRDVDAAEASLPIVDSVEEAGKLEADDEPISRRGRKRPAKQSAKPWAVQVFATSPMVHFGAVYLSVGGMLLFVFTFAIGDGPVPGLLLQEIFPSRIRAKAMAVCMSVHWIIEGQCEGRLNPDDKHLFKTCFSGHIYDSCPSDFITDLGARFALHPFFLKIPRSSIVLWAARGIASGLDSLFLTQFESQCTEY